MAGVVTPFVGAALGVALSALSPAGQASIVDLQPFKTETRVVSPAGSDVALTNLNPTIGSWYLLSVSRDSAAAPATYHLQNVGLKGPVRLLAGQGDSVALVGTDGSKCELALDAQGALARGRQSGQPYEVLCGGRMLLRNVVVGRRTSLERVTDFLRDRLWGGEQIIGFVKKELYRDAFLEQSGASGGSAAAAAVPGAPARARISPQASHLALVPEHMALDVDTAGHAPAPGAWYPVRDLAGVFFSALAPEHMDATLLAGRVSSVNRLDSIETSALVYLVAFDLEAFDLHFVLGTDHPRVDWSDRPPEASFDPRLPGPDGIGTSAPLVRTGMVAPPEVERTVAAFVGGFKRSHGAFRYGELALRNHGSHYGFIEDGVVFSKLQPGLATVFALDSGAVSLKTWTAADDMQLSHVRYARQNGVPLIELDAARGPVPGPLVNQWGAGNWSGSANEDLRTLRAGLCRVENEGRRFLVYAYFSAATPSAMARVFQAYGCLYAMHLDMNALEHTYLALYPRQGKSLEVEHLVSGMEEVDRSSHGNLAPRFLSFPDDRDFFYLTRKGRP